MSPAEMREAAARLVPALEIVYRVDLQPGLVLDPATVRIAIDVAGGAEDVLAVALWTGSGPGAALDHGRVVLAEIRPLPAPAPESHALPPTTERAHQPGWSPLIMVDPTGRRGLWTRRDGASVELCSGREGDDAGVRLLLTCEEERALRDVLVHAVPAEMQGGERDAGAPPGVMGEEALREIATRAEHGPDECREDVYALLRSHAALSRLATLHSATADRLVAACERITEDRDAARSEAERRRGQMEEALAAFDAWAEAPDGGPSIDMVRAAITREPAAAASPEPTPPEEMAANWRRLHSCSVPTFEDGVRAERASRSTSPVEQAAEPPSPPVPEVRGGG